MSSATQQHAFWGTIGRTFERLEKDAPPGFLPRVQVLLHDGEVLEPGNVREIGAWLFFEIDQPGDAITEDRRVVAVRPEFLTRVEIRFVRTDGGRVGFNVGPSHPDLPGPEL